MKFSIVTITYNAAHTIERTLRSVAEQTHPDIEYIIVDGASTDATLTIIDKYREQIDQLISESDRGIYDAMNKALSLATGDYLCFLNAGDKFHSSKTLAQIASRVEGYPDIIYGETDIVDDDGRFISHRRHKAPEELTWKSFRDGMLVCHQSFMPRVSLASNCPYDLRYRYSSDVDWCIKLMKQSGNICNTHMVICDYLNEGATTRHHRASLIERFHIMRRHYGLPATLLSHLKFVLRCIYKV